MEKSNLSPNKPIFDIGEVISLKEGDIIFLDQLKGSSYLVPRLTLAEYLS